jgi:superfamily II DNA or RNA helicase
MQLRDYQQSLATEVFRAWGENNKRVMLQLPTGGGKTILFGALASEFIARGETVLVLAHREELVVQAADKVGRICSTDPGIIKAGYQPDYTRPLQVASVQSLVNRLSLLETVGLAIADEAHHSTADTYRKILEAYPDAYQLGVTATPIRLDGTGFRDLFDVLLTGPTVGELISKGYLSPFRLYADPNPMTTSGVKTISGDYSTSGLAAANDAIELSGNLINSYCQYAFGKRCVVFAVNVEHSIAIASRYNAAGIRAYHLDGTTPEGERREVLERFRRGEIQVLSNCQLFDEGLDIPALEVVQVAKPTKSLTRWLQMVGRSLRPDRDKEYAIILDHTKNWAIHGLPTRMRTWTLDGVEEKEKVKTVRDGFGLVSEEIIIEETTAQLTPIEEDAVAGVFRQLKPSVEDLPLSRAAKPRLDLFGVDGPTDWQEIYELLVREQQTKGYKSGWLYYRLLELKPPLSIWQQYATLKGYKPGWAKYRYYEQQNS